MTQDELRARLENSDIKGATLKDLLTDRDLAKEKQAHLMRSHNELCKYNVVGGSGTPTDEVQDRMKECTKAIVDELLLYGAFVSRVSEEIDKRLEK